MRFGAQPDTARFMGLARAGETMEPDRPMFPMRARIPVSSRLGHVWLCCLLVAATACSGGSGGGAPDAAPPDTPSCVPGCTGDAVRICAPIETSTPCPLGCDEGALVCRELVPSNGADRSQLEGVTADLHIPTGRLYRLDTETGSILDDRMVDADIEVRAGGAGVLNGIGFYTLPDGVAVLAVKSFVMEADTGLLVDGPNALVILSEGDVDLQGQINASAVGNGSSIGGPGGGAGALPGVSPAEGCAPGGDGSGINGVGDETGGGGGGLGSDGAPGGVGSDGAGPGAGGESSNPECPGSDLVPLRGGSGGGGGSFGVSAGAGGGGGGGIQISSFTRISLLGTPGQFVDGILANGGGGGPGDSTQGAGGGGSGGGILLEAPVMEVTAVILAANGGGGGGADDSTLSSAGEDGRFDSTQAEGGTGQRPGGRGGALNGGATIGTGGADGTGGGGGGVGIIRFNVPMAELKIAGATISPAFQRGDPVSQ
jgi:hypothetical protein